MKFTQLLSPDTIRQGVLLSSKKRALELVGKVIADYLNTSLPHTDTDETYSDSPEEMCAIECFSRLFKREKLGSTSINNGIALPHAKLPENPHLTLAHPIAVFLQLETPIDYEAIDNKPVDLIFAVMIPTDCQYSCQAELANIAERLSDKNLVKQLRSAKSVEEIWQIFEYADQCVKQDIPEENIVETLIE